MLVSLGGRPAGIACGEREGAPGAGPLWLPSRQLINWCRDVLRWDGSGSEGRRIEPKCERRAKPEPLMAVVSRDQGNGRVGMYSQ